MNAVKPSLRSLAEQFNALGLPTTETPTGLLVQHGKELVPIHLSKRDLNVLHGQFIEDGHPNDEFAIDALIAELIELVATCPPRATSPFNGVEVDGNSSGMAIGEPQSTGQAKVPAGRRKERKTSSPDAFMNS